eukprot:1145176-Pelagomonas_calceolata.AAC.1
MWMNKKNGTADKSAGHVTDETTRCFDYDMHDKMLISFWMQRCCALPRLRRKQGRGSSPAPTLHSLKMVAQVQPSAVGFEPHQELHWPHSCFRSNGLWAVGSAGACVGACSPPLRLQPSAMVGQEP